MWLLNAQTQKLESFLGSDVPEYTILSHTWEDEEVTFQDITRGTGSSKKGYWKICQTCTETLKDNFGYAWVDTCCIDKTSSAELTESINSMFQWYQKAQVCYIYLSDLRSGVAPGDQEGFAQCRWFTRGWTLQELIAPPKVYFYDESWQYIGLKSQHSKVLSSVTSIDEDVLLGKSSLNYYSVAMRMSWAAHRHTTRIEDLAYCLLGIFDVNMPLIYGEGPKAFRRLQEEIVKNSNDLTVFAWDEDEHGRAQQRLFATSPNGFAGSNGVLYYTRAEINPVFAMTNKGLRMEEYKAMHKRFIKTNDSSFDVTSYSLLLGSYPESSDFRDIAIPLSKVGPEIFVRSGKKLTVVWGDHDPTQVAVGTFYIQPDGFEDYHSSSTGQAKILHIPRQTTLSVQEVIPQSHWDDSRRLFFGPLYGDIPLIMAACFSISVGETKVLVVVCVKFWNGEPLCQIFNADYFHKETQWLFGYTKLGPAVTWEDVRIHMPTILAFGTSVEVYDRGVTYSVSISLTKGVVKDISNRDIHSLTLETVKL